VFYLNITEFLISRLHHPAPIHLPLAGALLFAAGTVAHDGDTAETFRPGRSTRKMAISDLGASIGTRSLQKIRPIRPQAFIIVMNFSQTFPTLLKYL